uniref:NodT family RND efflux system n=1 Tax=uncultured bacterium BLR19 TaxID=506519 RepID=C0INY9_9BACT|nr:NodT family RND efflux system [uncultured bacterium BLR19]
MTMRTKRILKYAGIIFISLAYTACTGPYLSQKIENKTTPKEFYSSQDTINTVKIQWKEFFTDPYLTTLIDTALRNNQEFNIILQEINIANNEVRARKGEYLPFVDIEGGAGVEKVGEYTRNGAVEKNSEIQPGKEFPNPLPNYVIAATASWEVDIWKKLRNAKTAALYRYLSTVEGKNFMVTNLIAEIANSYYELMALDNQLEILRKNIEIQQNALEIVKMEKAAAKVTELAVRKFEAEVLKNQSRQFYILQAIVETENKINFLVGRFPQPVLRNSQTFTDLVPREISAGIPSQLLTNRPDIKQAELQLVAAKLDVKSARANFYPSLRITAGVGFEAFNPKFLINSPQSLLYSLGGQLMQPLINRNAIKAYYYSATSKQIQQAFNYEQTILKAYIEVANQLSNINNLESSYALKAKQVEALTESIAISTRLFKSARADYMEVLLTQRDALEAKFELIETKMHQMNARVNIYQQLGGGWN